MKSAQDYLAEKVQELELSREVADFGKAYWSNRAFELMKKLGMKGEEIEAEIKKALEQGA